MLAGMEASWAERDKTPSDAYVREYTRHLLEDEPIPGIDAEFAIWKRELPGITAQECLDAFRRDAGDGGVVVLASRPTREHLAGKDELLAVMRRIPITEVEPYEDLVTDVPLLANVLPPGRVTARREHPDIQVTELELSNGMHVILRPTDFQDDTILFRLSSLGGLSLASDEDLPSAAAATSIVGESGWGGHTPPELSRLLAGKVASASPYLDARQHGISGSSTVADLPTALELAVLEMTEPNRDPAAVERFLAQMRARLRNRDADPAVRYGDRLQAINTRSHPRTRPLTLERIGEIDPDKAIAFYRDVFANPADFTLFVVGNLEADRVIPEIERTLGSLPRVDRAPLHWVDRHILFPEGTTRETVHAGQEPRAVTTITLSSYGGSDPFEWHRLRSATSILERRLLDRLREEQGATYGVGVGYDWSLIGPARGVIRIRYGSDPADARRLGELALDTIRELQADGPTGPELDTEKEIQRRELESSERQNGYWLGSLFALWATDRPLGEIAIRQKRIDALTPEALHRVYREEFELDHSTWVDWLPEPAAAATGGDAARES